MTRCEMPMMKCDAEDGYCEEQSHDYYEQSASTVNGVQVTQTERAPGWYSTEFDEDYCPKHANRGKMIVLFDEILREIDHQAGVEYVAEGIALELEVREKKIVDND